MTTIKPVFSNKSTLSTTKKTFNLINSFANSQNINHYFTHNSSRTTSTIHCFHTNELNPKLQGKGRCDFWRLTHKNHARLHPNKNGFYYTHVFFFIYSLIKRASRPPQKVWPSPHGVCLCVRKRAEAPRKHSFAAILNIIESSDLILLAGAFQFVPSLRYLWSFRNGQMLDLDERI